MATLNATNLKHASSGSNNIVLAADGSTTISNLSNDVGKILQVVSTTKTDGFSATVSGAATTSVITGLTVTLTPASTNSKILLMAHISGVASGSAWHYWSLTRGGSKISGATGDQWGSNRHRNTISGYPFNSPDIMNNFSLHYLDSPSSTSAQTYGIVYTNGSNSNKTIYINQGTASDVTDRGSVISVLTAMEVAG